MHQQLALTATSAAAAPSARRPARLARFNLQHLFPATADRAIAARTCAAAPAAITASPTVHQAEQQQVEVGLLCRPQAQSIRTAWKGQHVNGELQGGRSQGQR